MTAEERFERIEHFIAGEAEQRRRDREEDRALWRDTQRQIRDLSATVDRFVEEARAAAQEIRHQIERVDREARDRIERVDREARDRAAKLDERVDKLVSAIGKLIADRNPQ